MARRKFSNEQIAEMRIKYSKGALLLELCDEYGASVATVYQAIRGRTYQDVPNPVNTRARTEKLLPKADREKILEELALGKQVMQEIKDKYSVKALSKESGIPMHKLNSFLYRGYPAGLTEEQQEDLYRKYRKGKERIKELMEDYSPEAIAKEYGVKRSYVYHLVTHNNRKKKVASMAVSE